MCMCIHTSLSLSIYIYICGEREREGVPPYEGLPPEQLAPRRGGRLPHELEVPLRVIITTISIIRNSRSSSSSSSSSSSRSFLLNWRRYAFHD